ncbi:Uncharacterised protein [Mycobacterium tuberculosis]|nr:Uncharacterised protein [Mycobacterium tuberculosis]
MSARTYCMVSYMAISEVNPPPGELMYIVMSRSGSNDSSTSSCAMMSFADASSTWTPRKMMRSSNSLL